MKEFKQKIRDFILKVMSIYDQFFIEYREINDQFVWKKGKPWFLFITLLLFSITYYIFSVHEKIVTESTSALYLLSTIAQSNASIAAIVISLSLVIIQHSTSIYSARVVDIFKKDLKLWILLFSSIISRITSLIVIRLINSSTGSNLEPYYNLTLSLSLLVYISLPFYIISILKMIKPSSIIKTLCEKIDARSLVSSREVSSTKLLYIHDERDPLLPIIDIICVSIIRRDYATIRYGFNALELCFLDDLNPDSILVKFCGDIKVNSDHLFNRICEVWILALKEKDIVAISEVIGFYHVIGFDSSDFRGNIEHSYITRFLFPNINIEEEQKFLRRELLYTSLLAEYSL